MLQAAQSLMPIVLLVALGAALLRFKFIDEQARSSLDKFTYWIALPSLFVQQLASTDFGALEVGGLVIVLALGITLGTVLGAVVAGLMRLPGPRFGVFVQASSRGNLAFVGLPLIVFALDGRGAPPELVAAALVGLAALVPLNNALSVLALVMSKQRVSLHVVPQLLASLAKNPLIISAVLGAALGLLQWRLPVFIDRPLELLGQTAIALALVGLGGALIGLEIRGKVGLAFLASLLKVAAVPAITFGLCVAFALPRDQTLMAMIFAACPTATASYILTTQLGGDEALAATCVVVSTVLSLGTLSGLLILL